MSVLPEDARRRVGNSARRFFSPEASLQRPGLTGLRAFAALQVVAFHMMGYVRPERVNLGPFDVTPLITIGWVGVDVFFVLSGFLITLHLAERLAHGSPREVYPRYLRDRVLRVVPAYWAQIALLLAMAYYLTREWPTWVPIIPLHMAFLQNFSPNAYSAINGIYWSLPVEFSFYLVAPLVLLAAWPVGLDPGRLERRAIALVAIGIGISMAWRVLALAAHGSSGVAMVFWASAAFLPACAEQFATGVAVAILFAGRGAPDATRDASWSPVSDRFVLAGLLGLAAAMYALDAFVEYYWSASILFYAWHSVVCLPVGLLVSGVAMRGRLARAIFENPAVIGLGTISYSLYLWHPALLPHVSDAAGSRNWGYWTFAAVALPALALASAASYYLVERPFLRMKRLPAPMPRTLQ